MNQRLFFTIILTVLGTAGCMNEPLDDVSVVTTALTEEDCNAANINGKVSICHETASNTNTYVLINVSTNACVKAHSDHGGDFISAEGTCPPKDLGQCDTACKAQVCPDGTTTDSCRADYTPCCTGPGGGGGEGEGGGGGGCTMTNCGERVYCASANGCDPSGVCCDP